jgi:hypothetical protein
MREHDLKGIVAKRLADPYDSGVQWLKIKKPRLLAGRRTGQTRSTGHSNDHGQCRDEIRTESADDTRQYRAGARSDPNRAVIELGGRE